jgi:Putative peptidoglycan binding domain
LERLLLHLQYFKIFLMAIQLNDSGPLVKKWQQFLTTQGFLNDVPDGYFGNDTLAATRAFQKFYQIQVTGAAGSLTLGKAYSLGFNPGGEPTAPIIDNDQKMMQWVKENIGQAIIGAIAQGGYDEAWLAGICARETGFLFTRYANQGLGFEQICPLMKGDYSRRTGERSKQYHGFGFWQVDTGSFPEFVSLGKWVDPSATASFVITILDGKAGYLRNLGWQQKLSATLWERAITAAYNCGEGNVNKALQKGLDVDAYTFAKDYSAEVFRYRGIYTAL